jgi:hypothetical protein
LQTGTQQVICRHSQYNPPSLAGLVSSVHWRSTLSVSRSRERLPRTIVEIRRRCRAGAKAAAALSGQKGLAKKGGKRRTKSERPPGGGYLFSSYWVVYQLVNLASRYEYCTPLEGNSLQVRHWAANHYSDRSASIGSTDAARCAGTAAASRTITALANTATTSVSGSPGATP